MIRKLLLIIHFFCASFISHSQSIPIMRYEDKIRIREAISISKEFGDKIWKGMNEVPFVVLLVTDSTEFLVNHPYPSGDFNLSENDTILKAKILYRPRQFSDKLLATFPAVNGVNCIVAGTPEKTNKNSTDWIITLLHEHFHQYQFTQKDYYSGVDKLALSGGDQTGMWQLNYAFPYENENVINQYIKFIEALRNAVSNIDRKDFKQSFKSYMKQRMQFKKLLAPSDYRYFSFQIWQEGIARYTEHMFLDSLGSYQPSTEIVKLAGFTDFKKAKQEFYSKSFKSLATLKLNIDKRVCFYEVGFAEGLLLDKINPTWHDKYLIEKFYIESYYKNR